MIHQLSLFLSPDSQLSFFIFFCNLYLSLLAISAPMVPLPIIQLPLPLYGPLPGYEPGQHDMSHAARNVAFVTGLDHRDIFLGHRCCVVCGVDFSLRHCHISSQSDPDRVSWKTTYITLRLMWDSGLAWRPIVGFLHGPKKILHLTPVMVCSCVPPIMMLLMAMSSLYISFPVWVWFHVSLMYWHLLGIDTQICIHQLLWQTWSSEIPWKSYWPGNRGSICTISFLVSHPWNVCSWIPSLPTH